MSTVKKAIIKRAALHFTTSGIRATSIEILAKSCRISKKTFYKYFESKENLVIEITRSECIKIEQYLRMLPISSPNAIEEMAAFFDYAAKYYQVFSPVQMSDLKNYYPDAEKLLIQSRERFFKPFFAANLNRGIAEGLYRECGDISMTVILYCIMIEGAVQNIVLQRAEGPELLLQANSLFLHGIISEKGKLYLDTSKYKSF